MENENRGFRNANVIYRAYRHNTFVFFEDKENTAKTVQCGPEGFEAFSGGNCIIGKESFRKRFGVDGFLDSQDNLARSTLL